MRAISLLRFSESFRARERIKLWLELFKVLLSVLGVASILFGVLQLMESNEAADQAVYQKLSGDWRDNLRRFVDMNTSLRPYFYDPKTLRDNDPNRDLSVMEYDRPKHITCEAEGSARKSHVRRMRIGRGAAHGFRQGRDGRGVQLSGGSGFGSGGVVRGGKGGGSRVCRRCVGELEIGRLTV
jgi:hypothetical protein